MKAANFDTLHFAHGGTSAGSSSTLSRRPEAASICRGNHHAAQSPQPISDLLALRQNFEQLANLPLLDEGMPQGKLRLDLVAVPPALSLAQDVALFDQLGQNPVGSTLGDANSSGNVAQADARVMSHTYKDVGVVGQKVPAGD
jgi:hypothetical protein